MAASRTSSVANRAATAAAVAVLLVVGTVAGLSSDDTSPAGTTPSYTNVAIQNDHSRNTERSGHPDETAGEQPGHPSGDQQTPGEASDSFDDLLAGNLGNYFARSTTPGGGQPSDRHQGSGGQERGPTASGTTGGATGGAYVVSRHRVNEQILDLTVYSPALSHKTGVRLLLPPEWTRDPNRSWPTLYMMPGYHHYYSYSKGDWRDWTSYTDIEEFMKGRPVLTVLPSGGGSGTFTNWWNGGDRGAPRWETYHTQELPALLERLFGASSEYRAIAGISLGGYAAVEYAVDHPEMYDGVASYSGVLHPLQPGIPAVLKAMWTDAGLKPKQVWGQPYPFQQRDIWRRNDPWYQANRLCGENINLYLSAGTGLPGKYEDMGRMLRRLAQDPGKYFARYTLGILLEAGARATTESFESRLRNVCGPVDSKGGLEITTEYQLTGTHTWPYWQDAFRRSWPMLAESLGLPEPAANRD